MSWNFTAPQWTITSKKHGPELGQNTLWFPNIPGEARQRRGQRPLHARRNLSALVTTKTELNAIAPPANIGDNIIPQMG